MLKTPFNKGIKPPKEDINQKDFYIFFQNIFFFDRQILKLQIILSLSSSIVLDESS